MTKPSQDGVDELLGVVEERGLGGLVELELDELGVDPDDVDGLVEGGERGGQRALVGRETTPAVLAATRPPTSSATSAITTSTIIPFFMRVLPNEFAAYLFASSCRSNLSVTASTNEKYWLSVFSMSMSRPRKW